MKLNLTFIYKRWAKKLLRLWAREEILICIKAPDQIYRTHNPAISIFRWCVFFLVHLKWLAIQWNRSSTMKFQITDCKPGKAHTGKKAEPLSFVHDFFFFVRLKEKNERIDEKQNGDNLLSLPFLCVSERSQQIASFSRHLVACVQIQLHSILFSALRCVHRMTKHPVVQRP